MGPRDWNAGSYDRVSDPMTAWGNTILERLPLAGDERVLDAGCGTGRVTEALRDRLPAGRVIALDASPSMLAEARRRLGDDRVEYLLADLGRRGLPIGEPVDAVFSNATFHWITDHEALFANLAAVLRPGGRLVAQCGGAGNIASVLEAARHVGHPGPDPFHFAGADDTRRRLESAGFVDVETWLHRQPTPIPPEALEEYLATVVLGSHLEQVAPDRRRQWVGAVAERLPTSEIDYVRLNILARRPA